jgi:ribosomal protein S18 acetylase RimI-like enzyme
MIARLCEGEISAAIALWEAAGLAHPWNNSMRDIRLALGCPTAAILAAHDDTGALTGTVMAGFDGHRGWLYSLAVAESARGSGVGIGRRGRSFSSRAGRVRHPPDGSQR